MFVCWKHVHQQLPQPVARCIHRQHPGHVHHITCSHRHRITIVVTTSAHKCVVVATARQLHNDCFVAQPNVLGGGRSERPGRERTGVGELCERTVRATFWQQSDEGTVSGIRLQLCGRSPGSRTISNWFIGRAHPRSTDARAATQRTHCTKDT